MNHRFSTGVDDYPLPNLSKPGTRHADGVFANRHGVENKPAVGISGRIFHPVRRFGHHHRPLNRTMLRIMDDASDRAEDTGERRRASDHQNSRTDSDLVHQTSFVSASRACDWPLFIPRNLARKDGTNSSREIQRRSRPAWSPEKRDIALEVYLEPARGRRRAGRAADPRQHSKCSKTESPP